MAWFSGFWSYWTPAIAVTVGCSSILLPTPHVEDDAAPFDYYAEAKAPKQSCSPAVELVREASTVHRTYAEVASLSASCYPGAPQLCEQRLLVSACEHQADALILMSPEPGSTPLGASRQSQVSMSGRAVRWTD
jgi:hypothetical protein